MFCFVFLFCFLIGFVGDAGSLLLLFVGFVLFCLFVVVVVVVVCLFVLRSKHIKVSKKNPAIYCDRTQHAHFGVSP